ncbi:hypothetical protein [Litoribacillus peritrichatus]|uniref:Uncharacterized protein n=1 Tax=Litoribacillus peritrichatus TaxID=718191 RepID=A0ABP7MI94_9GAMM
MKLTHIFSASILALACSAGSAFAGTPGLTGIHTGNYDLQVKTTSGALKAISYKSYSWTWDFDAQTATFDGGYIRSPHSIIPLAYKAHTPIELTDNGDGTYTADYEFQAYNPLYGNPKAATSTTFEITDTGSGLQIKTLDTNNNGVPGTPIIGIFPFDIELDWAGVTN